ncbi:DUF6456 domain-containing protein [Planktotalea sp.]|uniref:DUF6456 domain-containing protein n=1 Tax=Planktotalea sp. TaxID=2029877 RepID=UPI00329818AC
MTHLSHMHLAPAGLSDAKTPIPAWVPEAVQRYLTHTEEGLTIRELARRSGCHASTVMRQIRKIEVRRDDPLVDRALHALSSEFFQGHMKSRAKESTCMNDMSATSIQSANTPDLDRQTLRILNRLCETGAVLAVAEGMETAVVVRETAGGATSKTASVSAEFVSVLALNDWVECPQPARISRYRITASGRSKMAELALLYDASADVQDEADAMAFGTDSAKKRRIRYSVVESPVTALSRRKAKDGAPFLNESLVNAAERLREDFELAQMGPQDGVDWQSYLTAAPKCDADQDSAHIAPRDARDRVGKALSYLGPGLGDVALQCCCFLEGLESTEKRMGWSARSGKIVLRIALQRLCVFYETELGDVLIG